MPNKDMVSEEISRAYEFCDLEFRIRKQKRSLVYCVEDLGSVLRNHILAHSHLQCQFPTQKINNF